MTIYKKPDLKVFGSNAKPTEIAEFEDLLRGWGVTIEKTNGIPPMEWFNYLFNRLDGNINYILQNGVTEYDTSLEYPQNAIVKSGGKLYLCLRQNTNKPLSNGVYWELLIKNATTSRKGVVQLSSLVTSTDETKASTPKATKVAYDKGVEANNNANKAQQRADSAYSLATTKENKITRSDSVTSNSSVNVATSKAVKNVNDKTELNAKNINDKVSKNNINEIDGYLQIQNRGDYVGLRMYSQDRNLHATFRIDPKSFNNVLLALNKNGKTITVSFPTKSGTMALQEDSVRVGSIHKFASDKPQKGYLKCDGGLYSTTTYADLFAEIGYTWGGSGNKFAVPNLTDKARFLRSDGNGLKVGMYQDDAIRNINGYFCLDNIYPSSNYGGAFSLGETVITPAPTGNVGDSAKIKFDASRVVPTSTENRPYSAVVAYWIKY